MSCALGDRFVAVGHQPWLMPSQTWKERCLIAEQSFGMYNIRIHHVVFELCVTKKKEDGQNVTFHVGFLNIENG